MRRAPRNQVHEDGADVSAAVQGPFDRIGQRRAEAILGQNSLAAFVPVDFQWFIHHSRLVAARAPIIRIVCPRSTYIVASTAEQ
jgi:hypothetical protein